MAGKEKECFIKREAERNEQIKKRSAFLKEREKTEGRQIIKSKQKNGGENLRKREAGRCVSLF